MSAKQVFSFQEGNAQMKQLLGGKGAHLAEMTRSGLPVPPGFTLSTAACLSYFKEGNVLSETLWGETLSALESLESARGQRLGDPVNPLLVSVRSGSVTSMPGMMDTILNLGLNDETVQGLSQQTGNARFAYDCYRRLLQMFGNVVLGIQGHYFEKIFNQLKQKEGVTQDQDVSLEGLQQLIPDFKRCIQAQTGRVFPENVQEQLRLATEAVFQSWNNARAQIYRKINRIPDSQGTAVNIQSMVFGNMGMDCGTGVVFTRNPSTGASELFGEYLINAQGEDVVAGARTPQPVASLRNEMPEVYEELVSVANRLEQHYKDMQDIEFTVEKGQLFILQTRNGKRNAQAAVTIAVNLVKEGIITREDALLRIEASHLDRLLHRGIDESAVTEVFATGLPASPGAAVGQIVFDAEIAMEWSQAGKKVVLARPETTPEDIQGVLVSEGIVTCRGGMTSHAAVVARGMGKPCVCGCEEIKIDEEQKQMSVGSRIVKEGDWVTIEGASGRVILGEIPLREAEISEELSEILNWADSIRKLKVRANADNPHDARMAKQFGAQGIGLCRTEHMFFSPTRLPVVQKMILADNVEERALALEQLLPMQQADFEEMFGEMNGLPVTIRLLDPPLHEFLPKEKELQKKLDELRHNPIENDKEQKAILALIRKVNALEEVNPMLGQRGCRLGIVYPEIYEMQVEAIFRAASRCLENGIKITLEIMVPLVGHVNELITLRTMIDKVAKQVLGESSEGQEVPYQVGTMIEVPRAALTAGQIAPYADFFSFGTNDLTQMTYGYSRDDAEGKFLTHYQDQKILPNNPFQVLDPDGVGLLIEWAVTAGRSIKPTIKTGICGEHGGDKESIFFCHRSGLDYVSCSPFRLPLARIAAAQAAITYGDIEPEKSSVPISSIHGV
ncbi:pyruvate, phosphate dikinase [Cohnella abietis]|uniref:Pyruvate, phosphate dikinase n=1 Tax=Cohnella abietis TaxID=2507935 RepID=A0A3T1D420_9BACL|nr:pyruvate, phosphate dikinase [Cohnella abietis]BBI32862.1 pyruvate, phosphate dikinase [Cohnella abietis]